MKLLELRKLVPMNLEYKKDITVRIALLISFAALSTFLAVLLGVSSAPHRAPGDTEYDLIIEPVEVLSPDPDVGELDFSEFSSVNDPMKEFYALAEDLCEPPNITLCEMDSDCAHLKHYDVMMCRRVNKGDAQGECRERNGVSRNTIKRRAMHLRQIAFQFGASLKVRKLLSTVAIRESTIDPSERHRLDPDVRANISSYWKNAKAYEEAGNQTIGEMDRWSLGAGLFAANVSLHVKRWDMKAPPEILCDPTIATALYLRALRRAHDVYTGRGPPRTQRAFCDLDGDGKKERYLGGHRSHGDGPTLYDLHGLASGGRTCPQASDSFLTLAFERRARANGFDPYSPVKKSELGYKLSNYEILELRNLGNEAFQVQIK